jgi:predicted PurR-regulated permease PerM
MRHTLLPLHERITLRRAYRIRAVTVLLFLLSISIFIGIVALFPSFIKSYSEENAIMGTISSVTEDKDNASAKALLDNMASSKKLLSSLSTVTSQQKNSAIINSIISTRESLRLTSMSITKVSTSTVSVIIQGIAPTRNSLLSFKNRLESAAPGNKVDLPVSELSKSSNIQFSLKLTQQLP